MAKHQLPGLAAGLPASFATWCAGTASDHDAEAALHEHGALNGDEIATLMMRS
jgi:hypothetical protein